MTGSVDEMVGRRARARIAEVIESEIENPARAQSFVKTWGREGEGCLSQIVTKAVMKQTLSTSTEHRFLDIVIWLICVDQILVFTSVMFMCVSVQFVVGEG